MAAGTTYRLTGWVRTSSNSDNGYLPDRLVRTSSNSDDGYRVRTPNGTVLDEAHFTRFGAYTKVSVDVHTGANTSVVVYGGVWTNSGDIWMQLGRRVAHPRLTPPHFRTSGRNRHQGGGFRATSR